MAQFFGSSEYDSVNVDALENGGGWEGSVSGLRHTDVFSAALGTPRP